MVKFAKVGYGSDGRGLGKTTDGYTYVVNDNVRAQDIIYPSAYNIPAKRIIGTTGRVLSTAKETSVKGQKIRQELDSGGADGNKAPISPAYAMTTKEAGAKPERGKTAGSTRDRTERLPRRANRRVRLTWRRGRRMGLYAKAKVSRVTARGSWKAKERRRNNVHIQSPRIHKRNALPNGR